MFIKNLIREFFSGNNQNEFEIDPYINVSDYGIFIHIPKNAGTSLASAINLPSTSHKKAHEIIASDSKAFFETQYSFSVVRNPFDRFISLYNYARMEISHYHNNIEPEKSKFGIHEDYELLKNASINECAEYLTQGKLKHDENWNQWLPQYTWLYDKKGQKLLVNNVFKMEELDEMIRFFYAKFKKKLHIPVLNKSNDQSYQEIIDPATQAILEDYYAKDLAFFGYEF